MPPSHLYHDQGLIPFKLMAFERGVNFTAGLSVVRTSPDHGTAYGIAGQYKADESSFRAAVYLACDMVETAPGKRPAPLGAVVSSQKRNFLSNFETRPATAAFLVLPMLVQWSF